MKKTPSIAAQWFLVVLITVISGLALSRIVELNIFAIKLLLLVVVLSVVLLEALRVLSKREEAVKTNEDLLRLFIRHTPAAIAMFDNEMRYLQVSDRFLTDYHIEGQDIIGRSHYEVFPDIPERWREVHRRILAGAVERCEEDPYVEPDGSNGWLQWESLPWRKGNGEIGGLILFTQVITARKRAEEALRNSEERFVKIFNLSPFRMGILRIRDGVVLEVNDSWIRDTGFTREEVINRPIFALSSWMGDGLSEKVQQVLEAQQPVINLEVRFTSKSGQESIANTSAVLIELDNEPCYLWAANDITERKLAEEALQASESRFSIAFNSNPMLATISMLEGGRFLAVNDSFVTLTGYSREEAVGHTALELNLWPNPEDRRRVMEKLKGKMNVRDFEAKIRLKNGEERMLLLSIEKIELDGQACLLHVANDVTLRKRAEEALRALSARLHSAREEEGTRIAREIHDELGGALTGLKWDLEKIDRTLNGTTNGSRLPEVHKRIGTMTTLIETTINTVRRISSELRPGVLDDLGLVAAIEWQVQQFQSRTGLKCHWDNKSDEIELSREKATAVFRILQEILTNVLRHAQARNIYVKLRDTKECFELEVRDDGLGITESQRINSRSLGLLGMKERALLVGGEVNITGEEGVGTTVVVRVPLGA
jgi:PAS domain S-box-containing protein